MYTLIKRRLFCSNREIHLQLTLATIPILDSELTPGEKKQLEARPLKQQNAWRLGRAALKPLALLVNGCEDTSQLSFPHGRLSLAHTAKIGVAAAIHSDASDVLLGVDIETIRSINTVRAGRFCLTASESQYLGMQADTLNQFARLWTVKEALFKSSVKPDRLLPHYELVNPGALTGMATQSNGTQFCYCSEWLQDHQHWLSIALSYS